MSETTCRNCNSLWEFKSLEPGTRVRCPGCGHQLRVARGWKSRMRQRDWSGARCLESWVQPSWWFEAPDSPLGRRAVELCWTCPLRRDCLDLALDTGADQGIWGGLAAYERYKVAAGMPEPESMKLRTSDRKARRRAAEAAEAAA
jgi:transcription factor WhiB